MDLDRRSFIQSGVGACVLGTGAGVLDRESTSTTVEIKLYQTQNLTDHLSENKPSEEWVFEVAEDIITRTLERDFPDLSFTIERGSMDIPDTITDPKERKEGKLPRVESLLKWGTYKKEDQAQNANILFGMKEFVNNNSNGVTNTSVMPKDMSPVDSFSVIWFNPHLQSERLTLEMIVLHELGHCMGLNHYYGGNVDYGGAEQIRSIMLSRQFARTSNTNIFGEQIQDTKERAKKFNPSIDIEDLEI